jgi:hypothetical protein
MDFPVKTECDTRAYSGQMGQETVIPSCGLYILDLGYQTDRCAECAAGLQQLNPEGRPCHREHLHRARGVSQIRQYNSEALDDVPHFPT